MRSLYTIILKKFLASSLLPILVIESTLVLALFTLNKQQASAFREELKAISTSSFNQIIAETTAILETSFQTLESEALRLRNAAGTMLAHPERYDYPELKVIREAPFYRDDVGGKSRVYTTNVSRLDKKARKELELLALLSPLLEEAVKANGQMISAGWINLGNTHALQYPPIPVADQVPGDLDVTLYPFYYAADPEHNPEKEVVFLPLYTESWALEVGELSAYIAPIYADGKFRGVVGLTATGGTVTGAMRQLDLPYDAYAMLLDGEGTLLAGSDDAKILEDFGAESFDALHRKGAFGNGPGVIRPETLAPEANPEKIVLARPIGKSGFRLVLVAEKARMFREIEKVYRQTKGIGYYILLFITLFYTVYFLLAFQWIRRLARKLSDPLKNIVQFSLRLGTDKENRLEKSDIAEFEELNKNLQLVHRKLTDMLIVDELTGLPNRRKLALDLEKGKAAALLIANIDRFKHLNDVYGHDAGDFVIRELGRALGKVPCIGCTLYRLGGDEFAYLIGESDREGLEKLSARVRTRAENTRILYNDIEILLTVSAGMALSDGVEKRALLAKADIALSEAKRRKKPVLYSPELESKMAYEENLRWSRKVKEAIKENRVVPFFQPIVSLKTGRIDKLEGLARIVDGNEVIPPFFFIEPAKNTGVLPAITRRMIAGVFAAAQRFPDREFSINVSFSDFDDEEMLPFITQTLEESGVAPERIVFEVLETEALSDQANAERFILRLKELGCKVAIDDFGSGYSNFGHFLKMEVDYIKIDGQFIKNINEDPNSLKIAQTIAGFSKMLGTRTIAEFVATPEIVETVKKLGVDYGQGYAFSKPVPLEELEPLFNAEKEADPLA